MGLPVIPPNAPPGVRPPDMDVIEYSLAIMALAMDAQEGLLRDQISGLGEKRTQLEHINQSRRDLLGPWDSVAAAWPPAVPNFPPTGSDRVLSGTAASNAQASMNAAEGLGLGGGVISVGGVPANAYQVTYTDAGGQSVTEFSYQTSPLRSGGFGAFDAFDVGELVQNDGTGGAGGFGASYFRIYLDGNGNKSGYPIFSLSDAVPIVVNPTTDQFATWNDRLGGSTPYDKTLNLLLDDFDINASDYNMAKYVYGDGTVGHARLPIRVVENQNFAGIAVGTLVQSGDNYYHITAPGVGTLVRSPLLPATDVAGNDFSGIAPGTMVHNTEDGRYYLITMTHRGVQVDPRLQNYVGSPSDGQVELWRQRYDALVSELGNVTNLDQLQMQERLGKYTTLSNLISSVIASWMRANQKVAANI